MRCPKCKLENPSTALRCDCGYDFETKVMEESFLGRNVVEGDKKASTMLLVFGWVFAILGGIIGILIGYMLAFEKGKGGNGYRYDAESRKVGRAIFSVSIVIFSIGLIVRLSSLF